MSNRRHYLGIAIASLALGSLCYILLRRDTYISQFFGITIFSNIQSCNFFRFYLPDFLWCLALNMCLMWVYDPQTAGAVICAVCAFVCGCIWELVQCIGLTGGTADLLDITMYLLASILAILLSRKVRNKP